MFDCLIISSESTFLQVYEFIDTFMCFITCYTYMQYACFAHDDDTMKIIFEGFSLLSIIRSFMTDYYVEGAKEPVRDLTKIAQRYMKGPLLFDLIPQAAGFVTLMFHKKHADVKLVYLIKLTRMPKGFKLFDVEKWQKSLKEVKQKQLK